MENNKLFYGTKTYHQQFAQLCEYVKQYLGAQDTAYLNVHKDGSAAVIHSNCNWMEGYVEGKHYIADPHLVHPDNMSEGFSVLIINEDYRYEEYNDEFLQEAENNFAYGFTYVIKSGDDFTAFCFTFDKNNYKFVNTLLNQAEIIKFLIQKLHQQIPTLFTDLQQNKAQLTTLKGNSFFQQRGIVFRH